MTNRPWPDADVSQLLFILDAAHAPEHELLVDWLAETEPEGGYKGVQHRVVLPIATRQEEIEARPLRARLDAPDETLIVPLRVVWRDSRVSGQATPRFRDLLRGNRRQPGPSHAARLLRNDPKAALCIAGTPATLGELRERFSEDADDTQADDALAHFIADQAGLALDIAERQLRGGRYKVPRRVARNMQKSRRYRLALEEVSRQTGTPVEELRERSEQIFDELIAIPRTFWQDVLAAFNRKIISMGYQPEFVVDDESVKRVRDIVRSKPAVLLWTHKTHIDGFAVYSMLFENDFPVPHVLGGVNMAFAGLGYVARRSGAIFIRRSFQDDLLYKMILRQYIGYLLEKRFPLTWAFEGTRSRVGKLMPPRYGLLKYVVEAAEVTDSNDLHIIPVALNYDLIRDVKDYVREQSGAVKQPESLRWFLGYLRGLRQPLGKIYIDFGDPVVLSDPTEDDDLALKKIAFQVGVEANRVTPITLSSLVTTILLGNAPRALTRLELGKEMLRYLNWARERGVRVTTDFDRDNMRDFNALADVLDKHGLVSHFDEGPDTVYTLRPDQHAVASYYRNTTIHHFVVKAFVELTLERIARAEDADRVALFWREADHLRDLFKFEFFYAPREAFHQEVDAELSRYDSEWSSKLADDAKFASAFLPRFRPLVARAALLPFIEAYRVVANVVSRLPSGEGIDQKECVSQSLALAKQAYLQRRISSEASIGKLFFENAFKLAENRGLTAADDPRLDAARQQLSREFRDLANGLERLRVLTLPGDDW